MATFIEWLSGAHGPCREGHHAPIWCDNPEDWEDLEVKLVDQMVSPEMLERAKGKRIVHTLKEKPVSPPRPRKKNNVVLKGDDTTIMEKGTTYE